MRSAGRGKVATGEDGSKVTVRARGEVAIAQAAGAAVGQDRRAVGLAVWSAVGAVAERLRAAGAGIHGFEGRRLVGRGGFPGSQHRREGSAQGVGAGAREQVVPILRAFGP